MKYVLFLLFTILITPLQAQELSGAELLDKAIAHHDPNGNWNSFRAGLLIQLEMPNRDNRLSEVTINLPEQFFELKETKDSIVTKRSSDKGICSFSLNGESNLSAEQLKKHRGDCERTSMMKNYYTYLYGLPMKLKDAGTIIDPIVQRKTFKAKEYLVLKVTYDEGVGSDTWYFYFDPKTYAMEVYQFFKDEAKNDGEYILLSELQVINEIKIPKVRAWYYNKNNGYLGTDKLISAKKL
jgi:hypothetical protein